MINKVILVGRVGKDPEVRHFENNQKVANFTLATDHTYKNKNGERVRDTDWHNIVIWGGLVEIAEKYIKKGMLLYLEGRIRNRSYDDKDGNKKYISEILTENFHMMSPKETTGNEPVATETNGTMQTSAAFQPSGAYSQSQPDDLPF